MSDQSTTTAESETETPREELPRRKRVGLLLGPALAVGMYYLLGLDSDPELTVSGRAVAAMATLMAVWWMTEAIPLPATALIPLVALPLLNVYMVDDQTAPATALEAAAPYADPLVFLFMGGFMIALAMQKWNLHKRIALRIVGVVGTTPKMLVLGMMIATAFVSMWVSNTATALMMLPIAISVLAVLGDDDSPAGEAVKRKFSVGMLLAIAYAASIGGLATIIGSPPNVFVVAHMKSAYDVDISFVQWMMIGVPLAAIFLVLAWLILTRVLFNVGDADLGGGREVIRREAAALGPMSRGEWTVLTVFTCAALLWVFHMYLAEWDALLSVAPFFARLDDTVIAMAAGVALFLIPVSVRKGQFALDWKTVQSGMPWGVLLLFGGGLSLAAAISGTGLAEYLGSKFTGWQAVPLIMLVAAVVVAVLLLTELTSNTATAATFVPIVAAVGLAVGGVDGATVLAIGAALAASCAFMLPVATPPNAIVFGTGRVGVGQMIRAGALLNVVGLVLVTGIVYLVVTALFNA